MPEEFSEVSRNGPQVISDFVCFFTEMIEDWTLNYKPDLLTFVPYEWSFNIILRDFEMVWLGNQHNWIECASNRQNNGMICQAMGFVIKLKGLTLLAMASSVVSVLQNQGASESW